MQDLCLGRQAIFDTQGEIFAYELLYRANEDDTHAYLPENQRTASIHVLNMLTKRFKIDEVLNKHKGFIKVDRAFLLHDLIYTIPKDQLVLSVLEHIDIDDKLEKRLHELFTKGYELAINDMTLSRDIIQKFRPLMPYFRYAKFSTNVSIDPYFKKMLSVLKLFNVRLIATKIEDKKSFNEFVTLGAQYFQGFFFSKPELLSVKETNPMLTTVIELYSLLEDSSSSLDEIAVIFEQNPELSLQMLKILNSPLFYLEKKVSSILQALSLIGRQPLVDWVLLLVYSKSLNKNSNANSALLKLAKQRSELMLSFLKRAYSSEFTRLQSQAKLLGILSLYDVLFSRPIEEIFDELPLSDELKAAVLNLDGILGEIFEIVKAVETFETRTIEHFSLRHGMSDIEFNQIVVSAMKTSDSVERVIL
jgi:c-di-GMP phosphodiesterase